MALVPFVLRALRLLLVLGLLGVSVGPVAQAQVATPVRPPRPSPPTQPASGPGGTETPFPAARAIKYGPDPGGFWIWEPTTGAGDAAPPAPGPFPLVIYFSGCCADATGTYPTPEEVDPWLSHLARQGYVVVAPVYHEDPTLQDTKALYPLVLEDAQALLSLALQELEQPGHAGIDPDHTAAIGFSDGGWPALGYSAQAAAAGLPVPRALFLTAPCAGQCGEIPQLLPRLSAGVKALMLTYDHDSVARDGPRLLWEAFTSLPVADRDFVLMRSDGHGSPMLWATHETTYQEVDAFDWYGLWKLSDALFACTFRGAWCEYALGNTPQQRFMGVWSDGVPVTALEVTDAPETP
jgi:acetyl esterase/lipase